MTQVTDRRTCIAPSNSSPVTGYSNYGCRCYTCAFGASSYNSDRTNAIRDGEWEPLVDASPVIEHLAALRSRGLGPRRIGRAANLSPHLVVRYLSDTSRPLPKRIRPAVAKALLQVTANDALHAASRIPSLGMVRRVRALAAIGWSITDQAAELGVGRSQFCNSLARDGVSVERDRAVRTMYERLSGTPGPSPYARRRAERDGWAPPLAWEDEDLDNPLARASRTGRRAEACSRGHGFTPDNTRIQPSNGRRMCIRCESGEYEQTTTTERQAA